VNAALSVVSRGIRAELSMAGIRVQFWLCLSSIQTRVHR
jgi:hypothetical protein